MVMKFRKHIEDFPMLFCLDYVMDPIYISDGIKLVKQQIPNELNFETPITYHNIESYLFEMYEMHAQRFGQMLDDCLIEIARFLYVRESLYVTTCYKRV